MVRLAAGYAWCHSDSRAPFRVARDCSSDRTKDCRRAAFARKSPAQRTRTAAASSRGAFPDCLYNAGLEVSPLSSHEERFERIERAMEFLVQSDAALTARLDNLAGTFERQNAALTARLDNLAGTVEKQQHEISDLNTIVRTTQLEARDAIEKMIVLAEEFAGHARLLTIGQRDHAERLERLEQREPPSAG